MRSTSSSSVAGKYISAPPGNTRSTHCTHLLPVLAALYNSTSVASGMYGTFGFFLTSGVIPDLPNLATAPVMLADLFAELLWNRASQTFFYVLFSSFLGTLLSVRRLAPLLIVKYS